MDLTQLKSTDNSKFTSDTTFQATCPKTGDNSLTITIKSARNPAIRGKLAKLMTQITAEQAKLNKATVTDEQADSITAKIDALNREVASLVFVKFDGLMDGDKPVKCTDEMKKYLIDNFGWLCEQIVENSASQQAFFTK